MEKGEDDNKDNADDDDDEEQQLHKTMVRLKNPSKDRQMYWIAKTNCESRTVEPPYGFLNGNDSVKILSFRVYVLLIMYITVIIFRDPFM